MSCSVESFETTVTKTKGRLSWVGHCHAPLRASQTGLTRDEAAFAVARVGAARMPARKMPAMAALRAVIIAAQSASAAHTRTDSMAGAVPPVIAGLGGGQGMWASGGGAAGRAFVPPMGLTGPNLVAAGVDGAGSVTQVAFQGRAAPAHPVVGLPLVMPNVSPMIPQPRVHSTSSVPSDVLPPFLYTVVVQGTPGVGRVKTSLSLGAASVHEQQSSTALITRPPGGCESAHRAGAPTAAAAPRR